MLNVKFDKYILNIPHFEFNSANGKRAHEVILNALINSNPIFSVDFSSLEAKLIGNFPEREDSNLCLK